MTDKLMELLEISIGRSPNEDVSSLINEKTLEIKTLHETLINLSEENSHG